MPIHVGVNVWMLLSDVMVRPMFVSEVVASVCDEPICGAEYCAMILAKPEVEPASVPQENCPVTAFQMSLPVDGSQDVVRPAPKKEFVVKPVVDALPLNCWSAVKVFGCARSSESVLFAVKSPPPVSPAPAVRMMVEFAGVNPSAGCLLLNVFQSVDERQPACVPFAPWHVTAFVPAL